MKLSLKNVRCAYPQLFEPVENKFSGREEYSIRVMIPASDTEQVEKVRNAIREAFINKFGSEKGPRKFKAAMESKNTRCMQFDDENDYYYINLKRRATDGAPVVMDRNKRHLSASEGRIYGGCYVNAVFEVWVYDNASTGAGSTLLGVQFVKDGEPFSGAAQPSDDDFEDLGGDSEVTDDDMKAFM